MWHLIGTPRTLNSSKWIATQDRLNELRVPYRAIATASREELRSAVHDAVSRGADQFASVGGDGTANWLVNALLAMNARAAPTVGFLPFGTGCDVCRTFSIPRNVDGAAQLLAGHETRTCDVGVAEGEWGKRYFLNVADVGLAAEAARRAESLRWIGRFRYLAAFWSRQFSFRPRSFTLTSRSETRVHFGWLAVAANGRYFGGGIPIAPRADPADGKLEVLTFAGKRRHMPYLFWKVRTATHLALPQVSYDREDEVTIDCDPRTAVEVDGEYLGRTPVAIRVIPGALRVQAQPATKS